MLASTGGAGDDGRFDTGHGFKSSQSLRTPSGALTSVTLGLKGTSDPTEERFWSRTYGLRNWGVSQLTPASSPSKCHSLDFFISPGSGGGAATTTTTSTTTPSSSSSSSSSHSLIHQVIFGPPASFSSKSSPLAIAAGPRVGIFQIGTLHRGARSQSDAKTKAATTTTTTTSPSTTTTTTTHVAPDRHVGTGGNPALCAAFRSDGRLVAVGTDAGEIRVCDVSSRATLCTFHISSAGDANGNRGKTGSGGVANRAYSTPSVRSLSWMRNGKDLVSGGDDGALRLWTLSPPPPHGAAVTINDNTSNTSNTNNTNNTTMPLLTLKGHGDAIRCLVVWQQSQQQRTTRRGHNKLATSFSSTTSSSSSSTVPPWTDLCFSGSHDHTIRVWNVERTDGEEGSQTRPPNTEQQRCLAVLHHGAPVEALLLLPASSADADGNEGDASNENTPPTPLRWLISAGGTQLKVWNPLTGVCACTVPTQHSKTITSLNALLRSDLPSHAPVGGRGRAPANEPSAKRPRKSVEHPYTSSSSSSWQILTTGLDGMIRIHTFDARTGHMEHFHGLKLADPITSLAFDTHRREQSQSESLPRRHYPAMAIGFSTGRVLWKKPLAPGQMATERQREQMKQQRRHRRNELRAGTYAYFTRGINAQPSQDGIFVVADGSDHMVRVGHGEEDDPDQHYYDDDSNNNNDDGDNRFGSGSGGTVEPHQWHGRPPIRAKTNRKLRPYDLALRQFRYSDALEDALASRQPQAVMAVLEELGKRRGLATALSNRDDQSLEPILAFTVRTLTSSSSSSSRRSHATSQHQHMTSLLIGVANLILDIYGQVVGQSELIDELLEKLRRSVREECEIQKSLHRVAGQLDAIMAATETAGPHGNNDSERYHEEEEDDDDSSNSNSSSLADDHDMENR